MLEVKPPEKDAKRKPKHRKLEYSGVSPREDNLSPLVSFVVSVLAFSGTFLIVVSLQVALHGDEAFEQ